eukprot:2623281-Rhodomonas_salina.2
MPDCPHASTRSVHTMSSTWLARRCASSRNFRHLRRHLHVKEFLLSRSSALASPLLSVIASGLLSQHTCTRTRHRHTGTNCLLHPHIQRTVHEAAATFRAVLPPVLIM